MRPSRRKIRKEIRELKAKYPFAKVELVGGAIILSSTYSKELLYRSSPDCVEKFRNPMPNR
jgi:hypothetical protein